MASVLPDRRYTKTHEWIRLEGDAAIVGITDFAQEQLMDVVFVELPEVGRRVSASEACAAVESSKAAADVFAPISGEIVEANTALETQPELVNEDPFGKGWLFRLRVDDRAAAEAALAQLLDAGAYEALCAAEEH